ncbi:COG1361 S-layer family protein [Bariatricus sp. SGI.154]|uniref:COG1361 S-layer family protein n=1 Tax=Bariatricus sp. SGI.154 TaxID=3420549 RepID=UPI003D0839BB
MNTFQKILTGVCMAALLAVTMHPISIKAEEPDSESVKVTITSEGNKAPIFHAGQKQTWKLSIHNDGPGTLSGAVLAPELGDSNDVWPFKTEFQHYQKELQSIGPNGTQEVEFEFIQREDVPTSRYNIQFKIFVGGEVIASQNLYANTTAKPEDNKGNQSSSGNDTGDAGAISGADTMLADAGGFSNGGASYSGGGSEGSASVPRVIVTGFTTDPAEVRAGSNFTLTIHLKNTSKSTRVSNMLFDLSAPTEGSDEQTMAPAFLPASGSSSIYLEGIKANGTADISIQLNAKADLLQKPYSVDLSMKYEDSNAAQIEASSSISIPVKQDARFEFSEFEISPESIAVGDEANVMCNLYNLGRIKLYNVKATFEGTCIEKEEVFVGNVESGASASIDAMLEGKKATEGPAKVKMTVSYEDESGKVSETEKELQLEVMENMEDEMPVTDMMPEEQNGFPVLPVVIAVVVIAIIAVVVIILKKKKKKQMLNEEEGLLDELDRPSEDEQ